MEDERRRQAWGQESELELQQDEERDYDIPGRQFHETEQGAGEASNGRSVHII